MKITNKTFWILLCSAFLGGCPDVREAPSPRPESTTDSEYCLVMCNHLGELNCLEGQPVWDSDLKSFVPCREWCESQQMKGAFLNPRCISKVISCDDIEKARQKDPIKECK